MKRLGLAAALAALLVAPGVAQDYGGGQSSGGGQPQAQEREQDRSSRTRAGRESRVKTRTKAPAAGAVDRTAGMADAPGIVQTAGLRCAVADAAKLGQTKVAGSEDLLTVYEVACSEGPGYVLMARPDKTVADGYECFALKSGNEAQAAAGTPNPNALTCKLPANGDPIVGFRKIAQPVVAGCTIDQARYIGANATTKEANYEVGCDGRPGVILKVAGVGGAAKAPETIPCERLGEGSNIKCEYTTKAETLAPITALVSRSGRQCTVADGRYVGASETSKEEFYEAKCAQGAGFMVVANSADDSFKRIIECARASGVAGGCQLTDSVEALNAEAGVYKGLATKAGFNCDVGQYRLLGVEQSSKREVVELQCKERPEGVIAFLPVGGQGKADFYDCSKVSYRKLNCALTKPEQTFPRLTAELKAKNRTCQVNGVRGVGLVAARASEFVEVSCANGPGYMLEYVTGPAFSPPKTIVACAEATEIGDGCKLGRPAATATRR